MRIREIYDTEEKYQEYRVRFNRNRKIRRDRKKTFALEYLGGICVHCGVNEDLEFDHIKQDRKDMEHCISVMISNEVKHDILIDELDKCQLLCKPCHWEKTKKDLGQGQYVHGTATTYRKLGCRCTPCKEVHASYLRNYRRKRLEKVL